MTPSIIEADVYRALKSFLTAILPAATDVIQTQINRVPEPTRGDYVTMTPLRMPRLRTNVDRSADVKFTGSISADVLTVSAVDFGVVLVGATVIGPGVAANTAITSQLTGPTGGVGTYRIDQAQGVASRTLATGAKQIEQGTEVVIQLDVHGPASWDNAVTISTLFRDEYAVQQFADQPSSVVPLYADDPRQAPFDNEGRQYENRWIVEVHMQINPVLSPAQQYADEVALTLKSVDALYPPP